MDTLTWIRCPDERHALMTGAVPGIIDDDWREPFHPRTARVLEMGGGHGRGGHARGGYANFGRTTGAFDLRGSRAAGRARREAVGLRVSPELNGLAVANVMGRASLASAESVSKWQARRQHATATQPPRDRRVTATPTPLDDHATATRPPRDRRVTAV